MSRISPERRGLDAEVAAKMRSKTDDKYVREALEWIEKITGQRVGMTLEDAFESLKSGVILCNLLNKIQANTVKTISTRAHVLDERQNIRAYLDGCMQIGVLSQELFDVSDLYERKSLPTVITHLYGLGRAAQTLPSAANLPILGVRYTVSKEDRERREQTKRAEALKNAMRVAEVEDSQKRRRETLEQQKYEEAVRRRAEEEEKVLVRRESRRLTRGYSEPPESNSHKKRRVSLSVSPIRYGMDAEIHQKLKEKYDPKQEEEVMDWIEIVTGDPVDTVYDSLKSGVTLCKMLNVIQPGVIPKYNTKAIALLERENIQLYLDACVRLGTPNSELFGVSDLYEKKYIQGVIGNIRAVSRMASSRGFPVPMGAKMEEFLQWEIKREAHIRAKGGAPTPGAGKSGRRLSNRVSKRMSKRLSLTLGSVDPYYGGGSDEKTGLLSETRKDSRCCACSIL